MNTRPIQIACVKYNSAALKFLLRKNANVNVKIKSYLYSSNYDGSLWDGYITSGGYYYGLSSLDLGDNLLHICFRNEALDCLLILLPFCEHLSDDGLGKVRKCGKKHL